MLRNEKKRLRRESEREKASDKRDDRKQTREFINKKKQIEFGNNRRLCESSHTQLVLPTLLIIMFLN